MKTSNKYNPVRCPGTILYIGILILLLIPSHGYPDEAYKLLMDASKDADYSVPSMDELGDAERLFERLFNGMLDANTRRLSSALGLKLMELRQGGNDLVVIKEEDDKRMGRGFFIFRMGSHKGIAIQIPHAFSDIHTRKIGYRVFLDTNAHAIAFNTIKRDKADMAHIENSYFIAFAKAFAKTHPSGYVVQLHGFSKGKRVTASGKRADVIISPGRAVTTPITMGIYNCLKDGMDVEVSLYSHEARELGGKKNSTGVTLSRMGYDGFVHIEMSKELRDTLIKDEDRLKGLERCIQ
ncbi:MAG: hypothetical protein Fur0020_10110 [Thermodesulfovibrionia bacterium]